MPWTTLCDFDDLVEGAGKYVEIDGRGLALFRIGDAVYAIDNACPHAGAGLYGGWVEDGCIVCPLHQWAFDVRTGVLRGGIGDEPATGVYPTRLFTDNGRTLVQADLPTYGRI
jgi:nitrite reductase/ring-hydroxylating ferredoxin subunit